MVTFLVITFIVGLPFLILTGMYLFDMLISNRKRKRAEWEDEEAFRNRQLYYEINKAKAERTAKKTAHRPKQYPKYEPSKTSDNGTTYMDDPMMIHGLLYQTHNSHTDSSSHSSDNSSSDSSTDSSDSGSSDGGSSGSDS